MYSFYLMSFDVCLSSCKCSFIQQIFLVYRVPGSILSATDTTKNETKKQTKFLTSWS